MSRFVRQSKFRHVFGQGVKPVEQYTDLKVSRNAWDANLIKANPLFLGVILDAAGGGSFGVIDQKVPGKQSGSLAVFSGHKSAVLDIDFNPFNDYIVASCSEDCKVNVYSIGETLASTSAPQITLSGHTRKVGYVHFNPNVEHALASVGSDNHVKVWDITKGESMINLVAHAEAVQCMGWRENGNEICTSSKDKQLRVFDIRTTKEVACAASHVGVKPSRCLFLADTGRLVTTGFSKTSERQMWVWDSRAMEKPLCTVDLDTSSGVIMPFYDADTKLMYLAGKGDGNIRYFEFVDEKPWQFPISEFKSAEAQRGVAFLPKRAVNVSNIEVARAFKCTPNSIEPISFTVPRKADHFQDDIYPDCIDGSCDQDIAAWIGGSNKPPKRRGMEGGFVAGVKKQVDFAAPAPQNLRKEKDLENPQNDKEFQEGFHKRGKEIKILEDKLAQAQVQIQSLELKLKQS